MFYPPANMEYPNPAFFNEPMPTPAEMTMQFGDMDFGPNSATLTRKAANRRSYNSNSNRNSFNNTTQPTNNNNSVGGNKPTDPAARTYAWAAKSDKGSSVKRSWNDPASFDWF